MGNESQNDRELTAKLWLLNLMSERQRQVDRHLINVSLVYVVISLLSIFVNIGAIESGSLYAGYMEVSLAFSLGIRLILFLCCVVLLVNLYFVLTHSVYALEVFQYLGDEGLEEARYALGLGHHISNKYPRLDKAKSSVSVFLAFSSCLILLGNLISLVASAR